MKLDNTAAPGESTACDLPKTVCKNYYLVSIYYGISE